MLINVLLFWKGQSPPKIELAEANLWKAFLGSGWVTLCHFFSLATERMRDVGLLSGFDA